MAAVEKIAEAESKIREVNPLWKPLIDLELLNGLLVAAKKAKVELSFEPLCYGTPMDCKVVICNQALSPKQILLCLDESGLRVPGRIDLPLSEDLRPWAVQGVILLGANFNGKAISEWNAFMNEFFRRFCKLRASHDILVYFLLWGAETSEYPEIDEKFTTYAWTPKDANDHSCTHFKQVNSVLSSAAKKPIKWDNMSAVFAFTDGSCPLNGKPGARASFAAILVGA